MAPPTIGRRSYGRSPKPKKTSASARASRLSNRNGLSLHRHRAGSCSYAKVQDMLKTHQKPDGVYVDERARLGQLESSGLENVTRENLDQCEEYEIYVKVAGTSKQGQVFGLGALHNKMLLSFEAPSNESHASEEVELITQRLQEVEAELKQNCEENLQFQKRHENMENLVQSITSLNV